MDLYDQIRIAITNREILTVETEQRQYIVPAVLSVLNNNPQFFWFEGKYRTRTSGNKIEISPQYVYSLREIEYGKRKISEIVAMFSEMSCGNDNAKIKTAYDWLLDNVAYSDEHGGQNIYNALVERKAVCKGLSKAYQYLLTQLGIHCTIESGTIDGKSRHVWNVVELKNQSYYVDISIAHREFDFLFDDNVYDRYRCFMKKLSCES